MKKIIIIAFVLLISSSISSQKKAFSIEDLYRVKNVGVPAISNDGKYLAFTVTEYNLQEGKSNSDVYILELESGEVKRITEHEKSDYEPMWSADGQHLYFVSTREGDPQLFSYSFADQKITQETKLFMGISGPVLSPDNKLIAFSAEIYPECGADEECNKRIGTAAEDGPIQAYLADKLLFRHWDSYSEGKYSHILLYNFESKTYTDLTPGEWTSPTFSAGGGVGFNFSPGSNELSFMSNRDSDQASSTNSDIWSVDFKDGATKNITAVNKAWDGNPVYSPDGKYIAYKTQLVPAFEADKFRIAVYELAAKTVNILTEDFDYWVNDLHWSNDSKSIYFTADVQGYSPLYKTDVTNNKITSVITDRSILGFQISPDEKNIYYMARSVGKPGEIYKFDLVNREEKQLTFFNRELLEEVNVRPAEQMWVEGAEGKKVHVFLIKPHNFDPAKKYPLILNVHGGPQSQWMDSFRGDWQIYPGAGYVVAFPNPYGSTGYGQAYTNAISGDWGGKVYEDLMKVTDALEALPYVDKERIGAMGWSFGGYMMNWFQAKTKRFKCLASMMGIFNLTSMWGSTEELWFVDWDLKGQPWNSSDYQKWSPSSFVNQFSTPVLIITGEKDYRVPYTQSIEYFTTLQKLGIDSRLIIFKNDGHWPNHVKSMPLYYAAHLDWFHRYLGGNPSPYNIKDMARNLSFSKERK